MSEFASVLSCEKEEPTSYKLLIAAKTLFAEKGYKGVSVKQIAEKAGVNISLVSYHFGGKEGLYKACVESVSLEIRQRVARILTPPTSEEDFRAKILRYIHAMVEHHLEEPDSTRIMHRECDLQINQSGDNPTSHNIIKIFNILLGFVKEGQWRGYMRQDLDPMAVASFIPSTISRMIHFDPLTKKYFGSSLADEPYRNMILDNISKIYFQGISPKSTSEPAHE